MLSPVQLTSPTFSSAQCVVPSVNVGILVDLRQNARPADVSWSVSPVPFGSAYSQETGSPMAAPSCALSVAKPNTNCGACPGSQCGAAASARADGASNGPIESASANIADFISDASLPAAADDSSRRLRLNALRGWMFGDAAARGGGRDLPDLNQVIARPCARGRQNKRTTGTAAGQGFEPRFHDPESRVLPLDDPAIAIDLSHPWAGPLILSDRHRLAGFDAEHLAWAAG